MYATFALLIRHNVCVSGYLHISRYIFEWTTNNERGDRACEAHVGSARGIYMLVKG